MQVRSPNPIFRWLRAGLVLLSACMGIVLVTGAHLNRQRTHEASELLVRGQVDWMLRALTESLTNASATDQDSLRELLDELRDDGLEAVALIESDGSIATAVGTPVIASRLRGEHLGPMQIVQSQGRVVVTTRLPVRRLRRHAARVPSVEGHRLPPFIAFEFRPLLANRLIKDADRTFIVSIAVATALGAIAMGLWWQLERRERLERVRENERRLAQLGEMSAVLAHEIRNPLASLKGQAQLLVEKLPEGRESNKAQRIVEEAIRLEALSQTLLDFVRSGTVERKAVDVLDIIREAAQVVAPGRVHVLPKGHVERSVLLDPLRFHQVLVNLLQNAVDASADEQPIETTVELGARRLRIEIRDHGPGLTPGDEVRIFDPFETKKTHGTGLGLAIAKRIVELHDGTLVGCNHPDGGAVFVIEVPA